MNDDRWYGWKFVTVWAAMIAGSCLFWYGLYRAVITIIG